jgi:hypothetical protein
MRSSSTRGGRCDTPPSNVARRAKDLAGVAELVSGRPLPWPRHRARNPIPEMSVARRVILLEFNELCPPLLERWMSDGSLPNFRRFHEQSQAFVTEPDEKAAPYLEPWIQWYSIHTGLPYADHRVFHLTDGPRAGHEDIWHYLAAHRKKVWNCGSMNARRLAAEGSAFLPDPWCTTEPCSPAELDAYQRFVGHAVREHSNQDDPLTARDYVAFARFMLTHGLRAKTVAAIVAQLTSERVSGGRTTWRRAAVLDKVQFDVFRHYFRTVQPDFSTFFLNSTAHFQHSYWRHMAPERFAAKPSSDALEQFSGAILHGYQKMDELLGDFFEFERDGATLILATALSQQPYLKHEATGGAHFLRPRDVHGLLRELGVAYREVQPVMAHQFILHAASAADKDRAVERLKAVRYRGEEVFDFNKAGETSVYFGPSLWTALPPDAMLDIDGATRPLFDVFYQIEEVKSGFHHPDGVLWIKTGRHRSFDEKASILDLFPTILDLLGIPHGEGQSPRRPGRSLVPVISG